MQFAAEKVIPATLIAGDGIGPKIVDAAKDILDDARLERKSRASIVPSRESNNNPSGRVREKPPKAGEIPQNNNNYYM